jgi:tetratricopeptide (TPR) repeat protein
LKQSNQKPSAKTSSAAVIDLSKKARQRLRARRYDEAKQLFSAGLEQEPENPYLLSGMGDACRESADYPEAERCYLALLEVEAGNLFALRGLGDVYKKQERHTEALPLWEKYLALRPRDKHVMTRMADSLKSLQQYEQAEEFYQNILRQSANDRFALTGLADLKHRLGRDAEAIKIYEEALSLDENELHILTILGKLCWRVNDFDRAEAYFRQALSLDSTNNYALYGLGNCFRWSRDYDKAIAVWQQILVHSDGTQALHTRMGDAFYNLGQLDNAEQSYLRALAFGKDVFSTVGLIYLYAERQQWQQAIDTCCLLLDIDDAPLNQLERLVKRFLRVDQRQLLGELLRRLLAAETGLETTVRNGIQAQLDRLS